MPAATLRAIAPQRRRGLLKTLLPPRTDVEPKGATVYLKPEVWAELEQISKTTKAEDPLKKGYSRNAVIAELLEWGIVEWKKQQAAKKKK